MECNFDYSFNVEKNIERGLVYLENAKENKHIKAMNKLASIYYDGMLVKSNKYKKITSNECNFFSYML
jgi:TPR repeat protein